MAEDGDEFDQKGRQSLPFELSIVPGILVAGMLLALLFVGPWKWYSVSFSDGLLFDVPASSNKGPFPVIGVVAAIVSAVAAGYHRTTVDTPESAFFVQLIRFIFFIPVVVCSALFPVSMLGRVATELAAGDLVGITGAVLATAYGTIAFGAQFGILVVLYIVLPAIISTFASAFLIGRFKRYGDTE